MTVVEIDPRMTALAREYFRLKDAPRLSIVHEDGREYLNHSPDGEFDAVLMDAFSSLFTAPFHLTTLEAARQVSRTLKPDGAAILNLGSSVTGDASKFLLAELATYRQVFPFVEVFKVHTEYPDEKLQNVIIVASKQKSAVGQNSDPEIEALLQHRLRIDLDETLPPLTDDLAPVEYYNSIAQDRFLSQR
jgi:spermidine synthase